MAIGIGGEVSSNIGVNPGGTLPVPPQNDASKPGAPVRDHGASSSGRSATFDGSPGALGLQGALTAVGSGVNRATAIADAAILALGSVGDLLSQLSGELDGVGDGDADALGDADARGFAFEAIFAQIELTVSNAAYEDTNLLDGSLPDGYVVFEAERGAGELRLPSFDLAFEGEILVFSSQARASDEASTTALREALEASKLALQEAMDALLENAQQLSVHGELVSQALAGTMASVGASSGVSVDENLTSEGALLVALQVQQGLSETNSSITDGRSQGILSLFRG